MPKATIEVSERTVRVARLRFPNQPLEIVLATWAEERASEFHVTLCRAPECGQPSLSLGLCGKHYQKLRYYMSRGIIDRSWAIRAGRIEGRDDTGVSEETPETLPRPTLIARRADVATQWLLGWPEAYQQRRRLLAEAKARATGAP